MSAASARARAEAFLDALISLPKLPAVFNPWRDYDRVNDGSTAAPAIRRHNLTAYLTERIDRTKLFLIAEAPGFRGAKLTGIAMTSERILLGKQEHIPPESVFEGPKSRSSAERIFPQGAIEPTASIVWALMLGLKIDPRDFILWNSFPCHPHKPGEPLTNRPPTPIELKATAHILPMLLALAPKARLVAVGRVAERSLGSLGLTFDSVRHPAMGGANAFRARIPELLKA